MKEQLIIIKKGRFIDSKGINYYPYFIGNKVTGENLISFPNSILTTKL